MPAATEQEDASGGRGADDERREAGRDINIRSRGFTAPFAWLPALGRFCKTKCLVSESLTAERVHTYTRTCTHDVRIVADCSWFYNDLNYPRNVRL